MSNGELTEVERLKLENYALRYSIAQQQINGLMAERTAYIKQVEENHPGYKWDESKGGLAPAETQAKTLQE
jgi:hypothetical protein